MGNIRQDFPLTVGDEYHGTAVIHQVIDALRQIASGRFIQTVERFIQNQNFRGVDQYPGD